MVRGKITLDAAERHELQHRIQATMIAVRDRQRAEITNCFPACLLSEWRRW
jgi:hypothetical protein